MIKIQANPLVLAAALGLLGPAALADDDDEQAAIGGMWSRSPDTSAAASLAAVLPSSPLPARLGKQLQVLPVEDAFVIDDGTRAPNGSWDTADGIVQTIVCDSGSIKREFSTEGDALTVHTVVTPKDAAASESISYTDVYTRVS